MPTEGIYFVARFPDGWRLMAFRFDECPDHGHPKYWEEHVVPALLKAWLPVLNGGLGESGRPGAGLLLKGELGMHYDGFPRGRVTRALKGGRFTVFHGDNLDPGMMVSRRNIETAFGIDGRAKWAFDEHEQCSEYSARGLQSALRLRERWKIVSPSFD